MLFRLKDPTPAVTHDAFLLVAVAYLVTCRRSEMQYATRKEMAPSLWSDKRIDVIRHQRTGRHVRQHGQQRWQKIAHVVGPLCSASSC